MNTKKIWLGTLTLAAGILAAPAQAVPTSGAYVTDTQNSWVQDRVGDRIGTVNMIMCIMGNLKPDMMVNQGAYLALVDEQKCKGKADSSQATTTNAGAANASNYMSAVVLSTQPTAADPLIMKAWLHQEEEHDGSTQKSVIYVYLEATAGKSAANPNGLFKMYFCGASAAPGSTTCDMEGTLKADTTGLTFYNSESGGGGGAQITKLRLQQSDATGDNGFGKIQGFDNGSSFAYDFGYNPTYFRRSETGATDSCFARDQSRAEFSTWRYGTYKQDGSRLETANPGFPIKYVDNGTTYFGFWSFWGLWLPPSALADVGVSGVLSRQVAGVDQTLTVNKQGGKLWKFTRQAATLSDFKNTPLNYSACQATTNLPAAGDALCTNYTLQWNGANLQAVGKIACSGGSGCSPTPLATPINLTAGEFTTTGAKSLWIYSPAGDGIISVPGSGDFSDATVVYYRTRNAVVPGSTGAPASLVCVNNCPAVYVDTTPLAPWAMITSLTWGGGGQTNQTIASNQNWGPVPTANVNAYSYDGMLKAAGSAIDYSHATQTQMQNYQGGLQSGYLIDSSDSVALASIKCDANGTANTGGANYCPFLANQASTSYQWETGPNQWNQYFGASNSAGPITFDPPKNLAFMVAADSSNIRAADALKYAGSTLQLQSSGFGELQGIPGSCVDPDTNLAVANCDQQSRWVPAFDIRDGATVSDGTPYSIKYLEREMRLLKMTGTEDTSCKAALALTSATALTLPGADAFDINPITKNGTEPTLTSSKPAVIQGVMQ